MDDKNFIFGVRKSNKNCLIFCSKQKFGFGLTFVNGNKLEILLVIPKRTKHWSTDDKNKSSKALKCPIDKIEELF